MCPLHLVYAPSYWEFSGGNSGRGVIERAEGAPRINDSVMLKICAAPLCCKVYVCECLLIVELTDARK